MDLVLQHKFPLYVNNINIGCYICDFYYWDEEAGKHIAEDVKGYETQLWKWKRRHFESQYGIGITVVKR